MNRRHRGVNRENEDDEWINGEVVKGGHGINK
jgi:hypothetical protein